MKKGLIPIKKLISFWEDGLASHRMQMSPSAITLTEQTIKRLQRLEGIIGTTEDIKD